MRLSEYQRWSDLSSDKRPIEDYWMLGTEIRIEGIVTMREIRPILTISQFEAAVIVTIFLNHSS